MQMRILGIGLATLILCGGSVRAEETSESLPPLPQRYERPREVNSFVMERAQFRARQRMLRQEARAWRGISSSRPYVQFGSHAVDVNGPPSSAPGAYYWQPRW